MTDAIYSAALLLSWLVAMLSTPEADRGLVGAIGSLVVGVTLFVLLLSAADREAAHAGAEEVDRFEHLAFTTIF